MGSSGRFEFSICYISLQELFSENSLRAFAFSSSLVCGGSM